MSINVKPIGIMQLLFSSEARREHAIQRAEQKRRAELATVPQEKPVNFFDDPKEWALRFSAYGPDRLHRSLKSCTKLRPKYRFMGPKRFRAGHFQTLTWLDTYVDWLKETGFIKPKPKKEEPVKDGIKTAQLQAVNEAAAATAAPQPQT